MKNLFDKLKENRYDFVTDIKQKLERQEDPQHFFETFLPEESIEDVFARIKPKRNGNEVIISITDPKTICLEHLHCLLHLIND